MLGRKQYDEEMIRDFFHHLQAELAVCLTQVAPDGQTPNRELLAQLAWYAKKYDVCGLLSTVEADTTEVPPGCVEDLLKNVRAARTHELKAALDALDALGPVVTEALLCLRQPHQVPKRRVKLTDVMERLRASGLTDLGRAAC